MTARAAEGWIATLIRAIARPRAATFIVTLSVSLIVNAASARQVKGNTPANNTPAKEPDRPNQPGDKQSPPRDGGAGPKGGLTTGGDGGTGSNPPESTKPATKDPKQPSFPTVGPEGPGPSGALKDAGSVPPALPWVGESDGGGNGVLFVHKGTGAAYLVTSIDALRFESGERTVRVGTFECTLPDGTRRLAALQAPVDSYRFRVLPEAHPLSALCAIPLNEAEREQLLIYDPKDRRTLRFEYDEGMTGELAGADVVSGYSHALRSQGRDMRWQSARASCNSAVQGAVAPELPGSFDAAPFMTEPDRQSDEPAISLIGMLGTNGDGSAKEAKVVKVVHPWASLRDLLDDSRTAPITDARALSHFLKHHWRNPGSYQGLAAWALQHDFDRIAHWRTMSFQGGRCSSRFEPHWLLDDGRPDPRIVCAASEAAGEDVSLELANPASAGAEHHPALDAAVAIENPRDDRSLDLTITGPTLSGARVLVIEASRRAHPRLERLPTP